MSQSTTITVAQFRQDMPEFADAVRYPDAWIQQPLTTAQNLLDGMRWGDLYTEGVEYYTAHFVYLRRDAADQVAVGGKPGENRGPTTSKGIGRVSASFDTGAVTDPSAGHWNLTRYGAIFWQWANLVGTGGVQLVGDTGTGYGGIFGFPM